MICQPKSVLKGSETSPIVSNLKATSSNSLALISPSENGFNFPPFGAEFLSSENCFAKDSNASP